MSVGEYAFARCVDAEQDEEQDGEPPQRGAAVTEEWQRDADHRAQAYDHADVDAEVEYQIRSHTIGVDTPECGVLALGYLYDAEYHGQEQELHAHRAPESLFLAYGAEDEVSVLLGHVFELGLGAFEESFAQEAAGAYGVLHSELPAILSP